MGIQGKRTPPAIEEFVVNTKQNAPGLTPPNIADRVAEQFGEPNRIDRSSVPRILARAGLQEPTPEGATGNQRWDRKVSVYYQRSDRQLDREHRQTLMSALELLDGLEPLALHDRDLANWWSRPDTAEWPIPKGRARRQADGSVAVTLNAESRTEWPYLRQHFAEYHLWDEIENCKQNLARDLSSRLRLLDAIA